MSSEPVIFVNDKFVKILRTGNWEEYIRKNYPGSVYKWKDGYMLFITTRDKSNDDE